MLTEYYFERQARDYYHINIFFRFQHNLKEVGKYQVVEIKPNKQFKVCKHEEHTKDELRPRKYLVLVQLTDENFSCICGMFQKDGILCPHILAVLIRINKHKLPEKYFIDR